MYKTIDTEAKETLLSLDYIERLAEAVTSLGLSRRKTPDWLADVIFGWLEQDGVIVDAAGIALPIADDSIDTAHREDGSFAYVSALKRSAGAKRQRRPRQSLLFRLQLYDAAFKIVGRPVMQGDADTRSSGQKHRMST